MKITLVLSLLVILSGCQKYETPTYAPITLNGGQWMLSDYEIKIISCQGCNTARDLNSIEIMKTDSVGLQSFRFKEVTDSTITLTQDFSKTPFSRLFILDRNGVKSTKWEFETYELSTFFNGIQGIKNCWVSYNGGTRMTINDLKQIGDRPVAFTSWTYYTEKKQGSQPRELLILLSPAVTTDVLIGNRATDKLITYKLQLVFMRN